MSNFKSLMSQVVCAFAEAKEKSLTSDQLSKTITRLRGACNAKKENGDYVYLARERFAFSAMVDALYDHCWKYDTALVYHYNGSRYCVRADDVPGCKKTELLISENNLPQEVWDDMPRSIVWCHSGVKFDYLK